MDHTGEILGTSDLNCFDSAPSTNYLKECLNEGRVLNLKSSIVGTFSTLQGHYFVPFYALEPSKVTSVVQA